MSLRQTYVNALPPGEPQEALEARFVLATFLKHDDGRSTP